MAKIKKTTNSKQYQEDWLDNQSSLRSGRKPKKPKLRKSILIETPNATVIQVHPKLCHVLLDENKTVVLCHYKRSQVYSDREEERRDRSPFAVGDRVFVSMDGSLTHGLIEGLESRKNKILRISPERDQKTIQVLASNIDLLFIVTSVKDPHFSPGLVDRFLVAVQSENIPCVLILNKWDLIEKNSLEMDEAPWSFYPKVLGIECLKTSIVTGEGLEKILTWIQGKTVLFCGHSGVGKTSLVNSILKNYKKDSTLGKVGDVSTLTKKGKHTTTSAILYPLADKVQLIDTPGIRSFGIHYIPESDLIQYFPELKDIQCKKDCHHDETSMDCEYHSQFRGKSYLKLLSELRESSL